MKQSEFLDQVRQRMFNLKMSHEKAAESLHMMQSTFSRKLAGKYPFTYDEAESLKELLGMLPSPEEAPGGAVNPRPDMVKKVVGALEEEDQRKICEGLVWVLEGKGDRIKPEGQDALRALRALR